MHICTHLSNGSCWKIDDAIAILMDGRKEFYLHIHIQEESTWQVDTSFGTSSKQLHSTHSFCCDNYVYMTWLPYSTDHAILSPVLAKQREHLTSNVRSVNTQKANINIKTYILDTYKVRVATELDKGFIEACSYMYGMTMKCHYSRIFSPGKCSARLALWKSFARSIYAHVPYLL